LCIGDHAASMIAMPATISNAQEPGRWLFKLGAAIRLTRERSQRQPDVAGHCAQAEFAEKAGISLRYLSDIECGKHDPTFEVLMQILEALGVEPQEFFRKNRLWGSAKRARRSKPIGAAYDVASERSTHIQRLAYAVRLERSFRRIDQAQLSLDAAISRATLSKIENAKANPAFTNLLKIIVALKSDLPTFFRHIPLSGPAEPTRMTKLRKGS